VRDAARIRRLTDRVRWFDRYRRWVAIGIAAIIAPILIAELDEILGAHWPLIHSLMFSTMLGVVVWWVAEVSLAWLTALWETECDRLTRSEGLPRAELLQRRN
jgi:hypothetical protein